jgi:hypothetical protein
MNTKEIAPKYREKDACVTQRPRHAERNGGAEESQSEYRIDKPPIDSQTGRGWLRVPFFFVFSTTTGPERAR